MTAPRVFNQDQPVLVDSVTSRFHSRPGVVVTANPHGTVMVRVATDGGQDAVLPFLPRELILLPATAVA